MTQNAAQPLPQRRISPLEPPPEYQLLRENAPVSPLAYPDGSRGWLVTRFADVSAALVDPALSSQSQSVQAVGRAALTNKERADAGQAAGFVGMDPPEHTRYRRLLAGHFTARRMTSLVPRIDQIVDEHLDAMETTDRPVDLVAQFAVPITTLVICELLGVPSRERDHVQYRTAQYTLPAATKEQRIDAVKALAASMRDLVRRKREQPDDALISRLLDADVGDDVPLTDNELVGVSNMLLVAGHLKASSMIGLGILALLTYPDQWAMVRDQPSTIDDAVEELLRYLSIFQSGLSRIAICDTEIGGRPIAAGDKLVLALTSANRDDAQFDHPDILDVTRDAIRHVAFGHGIHKCLGQHLARMEMRSAFTKLTTGLPDLRLAVPAAEVPMRDEAAFYGVDNLPVTW